MRRGNTSVATLALALALGWIAATGGSLVPALAQDRKPVTAVATVEQGKPPAVPAIRDRMGKVIAAREVAGAVTDGDA